MRGTHSSTHSVANPAAVVLQAMLPGLSVRAQPENVLVRDLNDAVFGANWIGAHDPAEFVPSVVDGNGLRLLPEEMHPLW